MLIVVFWAALFLVVYTYLIYPVLLWLLAAGRKMPEYAPLGEWPAASLIIAAHNEEAVLCAKLENALAMDYPAEQLDIIVVSDASTDGTDRIAAEFAERGVRLHRQAVRGGKTEAQNAGVRLARGQFLAFSDANSMYAPSALKRLLAPLCRRADRLRLRRAAIRQPGRARCRQGRGPCTGATSSFSSAERACSVPH